MHKYQKGRTALKMWNSWTEVCLDKSYIIFCNKCVYTVQLKVNKLQYENQMH